MSEGRRPRAAVDLPTALLEEVKAGLEALHLERVLLALFVVSRDLIDDPFDVADVPAHQPVLGKMGETAGAKCGADVLDRGEVAPGRELLQERDQRRDLVGVERHGHSAGWCWAGVESSLWPATSCKIA